MRAWLNVDLEAIRDNYDCIRKEVGDLDIITVVKNNAYGLGIEQVVKSLAQKDVSMFAVVIPEEAHRVREFTDKPILLMGFLNPKELTDAIEAGYVLSLYDKEQFAYYQRTAERMGMKFRAHLKVETGFNRLGVSPEDAAEFLCGLHHFPNISLEAMFSHLACSDNKQKNLAQLRVMQDLLVDIRGKAPLLPIHLVSSGSLKEFKEGYFDAIRVGLAAYGGNKVLDHIRPVISCRSLVMQVKDVDVGKSVSYGHTFTAKRPTKIAIVSIGYGDGLSQPLADSMKVLIRGQKLPVIARVGMNHISVDVTDGYGIKMGDEVVIIGSQKDDNGTISEITIAQLAEQSGIRHHEIMTRLGMSLPKRYTE